jgi:hypothetical protein
MTQLRTQAAALNHAESGSANGAQPSLAPSTETADRIAEIEAKLQTEPPTQQLIATAQRAADRVVVSLRAVLGELADAGDFNQLVEELREISKRQQQLRERTRKEQQKSLLE